MDLVSFHLRLLVFSLGTPGKQKTNNFISALLYNHIDVHISIEIALLIPNSQEI